MGNQGGFTGNQEGLRKLGVYGKPGCFKGTRGFTENQGFRGNQAVNRKPGSI